MFHSETQTRVNSATKRPAVVVRDDNDVDNRFTCPSTLSDHEEPEIVHRRLAAPPELEKSVDDELVLRVKSPTGPGFQLMTSSSGVAAPPPWSAYRSAGRILAPAAPSVTAFHLAAFHSIYASQQQQQQMRQTHQMPSHLRLSLFTDASSAPGV